MDHLQSRLEILEQQMHTVNRRLRWWRSLACGAVVLAVLTWALPAVIAQEENAMKGPKGLAQRVEALEKLLKHFSREKNEIFITGANLHLVNGLGRTNCTDKEGNEIPDCPNGLGNLIVGYNESRAESEVGGGDDRTGSHNVVVGQQHNFSRFGGLVVGLFNTISGDFASVSGGSGTASGFSSSVSGGAGNTASGGASAVSGGGDNSFEGVGNTASGAGSSVSGGLGNTASGEYASVTGGGADALDFGSGGNTASGPGSSVTGGWFNTATGNKSSVSGGIGNTASGGNASVSGGENNTASGNSSSVSGGQNITQETEFGWSAGSEADEVVVGNFRAP